MNHLIEGNLLPLNIKHLSGSRPKESMGAVRRHRFSSAGCCKITRRHLVCIGSSGKKAHQQTAFGLLKNERKS